PEIAGLGRPRDPPWILELSVAGAFSPYLLEQFALRGELYEAIVTVIRDPYVIARIDGDVMDGVERFRFSSGKRHTLLRPCAAVPVLGKGGAERGSSERHAP